MRLLSALFFAALLLAAVSTPAFAKRGRGGRGGGGGGGRGNNGNNGGAVSLRDGKCGGRNGFPASPVTPAPFTQTFATPKVLQPSRSICDKFGRCMDYFEMHVTKVAIPMVGASNPATEFFAYDSVVPGPTLKNCRGRMSMVRFINDIPYPGGRKISVHLHGAASLAPYDGWADDTTNSGFFKDYIYPNNRAATLWYHDHAVHITSNNAYFGLASQYWVENCCSEIEEQLPGEPYDYEYIIGDKVLDSNFQLWFDKQGDHKNNLYGDINLVNGVPFPLKNVERRKYRFRLLVGGPTRPYHLRLSDNSVFHVIGSDGGLLEHPVPTTSIRLGVAERWEIIVDFSKYNIGDEVYMLNDPIDSVPMFCQSHLMTKFVVTSDADPSWPDLPLPNNLLGFTPLSNLGVNEATIQQAIALGNVRTFRFHRQNGMWKINGLTWGDHESRVIADPARNGLEVWYLENNSGGWFHPIHIHLIDFLVIAREGGPGVRPYEVNAPKDVVYLGPNERITVATRFGASSGDFMFHCHNLVHEDNDMMLSFGVADTDAGELPGTPPARSPTQDYLRSAMGDRSRDQARLAEYMADDRFLLAKMYENVYDVFYPPQQGADGSKFNPDNVWEVDYHSHYTCPVARLGGHMPASFRPLMAEPAGFDFEIATPHYSDPTHDASPRDRYLPSRPRPLPGQTSDGELDILDPLNPPFESHAPEPPAVAPPASFHPAPDTPNPRPGEPGYPTP